MAAAAAAAALLPAPAGADSTLRSFAAGPFTLIVAVPAPVYARSAYKLQVSFSGLTAAQADALQISAQMPAVAGADAVPAIVKPGPQEGAPDGVFFVELTTPDTGDRTIAIAVSGPQGSGTARVPLHIEPVQGGVQQLIGAVIVIGGLLAAYFFYRRRGALLPPEDRPRWPGRPPPSV